MVDNARETYSRSNSHFWILSYDKEVTMRQNQQQPGPLLRDLIGPLLPTLLQTLLTALLQGCQEGAQEVFKEGLDVKVRPGQITWQKPETET